MKVLKFIMDSYPGLDYSKNIVEISDTNRVSMLGMFRGLGFSVGAEIGTLKGAFAMEMFGNIPGLRLYCIDPYVSYPGYREHRENGQLVDFELQAKELLKDREVHFVKEYSVKASEQFSNNSLDFVYIDANHAFRHVVDDIDSWYPKVKHGGIISGHDFLRHKNSAGLHVVQAVTAFCDSYEIKPLFVLGRKKATESGEKRDRFRSWFFIKP